MATIKRDCPHCGAGAMTFTVPWSGQHPVKGNYNFNAVGICGGCGNPAAILATHSFTNNPPHGIAVDIEAGQFEVEGFWPRPRTLDIPRHLPPEFVQKLTEAERSFAAGIHTGAAGLYRSLIDTTTKRQLTEEDLKTRGTLEARIERLAEMHVIPDAMASWAHEVRVIANDGLHDEPVVSKEDAEMARSFALTYLRYTYELPGDVQSRRKPKPAAGA